MSDDDLRRGLRDLAGALGVETFYWDVDGGYHEPTDDTLLAVMRAWGAPLAGLDAVPEAWAWRHDDQAARVLEPVVVRWEGTPLGFRLQLPTDRSPASVAVHVVVEDGGVVDLGSVALGEPWVVNHGDRQRRQWWLEAPCDLPVGYHRLVVVVGDDVAEATLLSAPNRVQGPAPGERSWGLFAPIYSFVEGAHFGSLGRLGDLVDAHRGQVVATLPVLATFLDDLYAPSPYSPVSRRFWNEAFCDMGAGSDAAHHDPALAALVGAPEAQADLALLAAPGPFDYRRQGALVRRILGNAVAAARDRGADLTPDAEVIPDLARYAAFRATVEATGRPWSQWPERMRRGDLREGDYDPSAAAAHTLGQVLARRQLLDLAGNLAQRGQHLYLDLPVGAHPDGFDAWERPDRFAWGVAVGAPPDDFFTEGQNWGFPPLSPPVEREAGHAHFRDCLRHHMEVAGMLRLDHVMGLHRLYWVPDGMAATEGAYVRYAREELFAVLAIESRRHDCIVVGEDLGTVPDEVRDAMERHELLGMYVAEFQVSDAPGAVLDRPGPRSAASLDTHDTATFAAFLHGLDIPARAELRAQIRAEPAPGPDDLADEFEARARQVDNLRRTLDELGLVQPPGADHDLVVALLRFLGGSEAPFVLVALEDLWGEISPQNVPGTSFERPNWVQKFPFTLDAAAADTRVSGALAALARSREVPT